MRNEKDKNVDNVENSGKPTFPVCVSNNVSHAEYCKANQDLSSTEWERVVILYFAPVKAVLPEAAVRQRTEFSNGVRAFLEGLKSQDSIFY